MRIAFETPVTPARVSASGTSGADACRSSTSVLGVSVTRLVRYPPMSDDRFPRVVSLACHDLRTPLATVYGFARTLSRGGDLDERNARFVGMIEAASEQMTDLLDQLGVLARIESDRYDVGLVEADTVDLATTDDERVETVGEGVTLETDERSLKRALEALAVAAVRHGGVPTVTWTVRGRELELAPV